MVSEKKYSIIAVGAQDEIVIQAGITPSKGVGKLVQDNENQDRPCVIVTIEGAVQQGRQLAEQSSTARLAQDSTTATQKQLDLSETTSRMRRVILASALLFLVAFLIYFNFLR